MFTLVLATASTWGLPRSQHPHERERVEREKTVMQQRLAALPSPSRVFSPGETTGEKDARTIANTLVSASRVTGTPWLWVTMPARNLAQSHARYERLISHYKPALVLLFFSKDQWSVEAHDLADLANQASIPVEFVAPESYPRPLPYENCEHCGHNTTKIQEGPRGSYRLLCAACQHVWLNTPNQEDFEEAERYRAMRDPECDPDAVPSGYAAQLSQHGLITIEGETSTP